MKKLFALSVAVIFSFLLFSCGGGSSTKDADVVNDSAVSDDDVITFGITDAAVAKNEKVDLTCFLSWTTAEPATSSVEFGVSADYEFVKEDATLLTTHNVLVIGMHADTLYHMRAVSVTAGGTKLVSDDLTYTTGTLPEYIPNATVNVYDKTKAFDGWTAMTLSSGTINPSATQMSNDPNYPITGVIYDMEGFPVWYYVHKLTINGGAEYYDGKLLFFSQNVWFKEETPSALLVDLSGEVLWTGPQQPVNTLVDKQYHHGFIRLPNGNFMTLREIVTEEKIIGDEIIELDKDNNEVWTWSTFDHLTPDTSTWDKNQTPYFDWTHINSLDYDAKNDIVYANARNIDTTFKIDKKSGELIWQLGRKGDITMTTESDYPWFLKAHGMEQLDNGDFILYDNGDFNEPDARIWSRAIIYHVNDEAKTAEIVWEYRGETPWVTYYWGDADQQPNGNIIITAGTWDNDKNSKIFEVTPEKEKVWEFEFPHYNENTIGMYDSCRFTPPVKKIEKP